MIICNSVPICNASSIHNDYGIQALPTFILINPNGDIGEQDIWPFDTGIMASTLYSHGLNPATCSGTVSVEEIEDTSYNFNNNNNILKPPTLIRLYN